MSLAQALEASPALLLFATAVLGLMVGSFLNVVALRLPLMLEQGWQSEARAILGLADEAGDTHISLLRPASRCGNCGASVRPWQNIPVLSWLLLRGRCASCRTPISVQYPLVELTSALIAAACAWRFGFSGALAGALLLSWSLLALAVIDLHTQLLPDAITLPLLWAGLAFALFGVHTDIQSAVIGAMAGYLSLWSVYWLFKLTTGKEGMGYGDFKLLAALGAWLGWQALPLIILLSSLVGAAVGLLLIATRRLTRDRPMPFGPYLASAGWIALLWGTELSAAYLGAGAP